MPISKNSTVTPRRSPRNHSKTSPTTTSTMLREGLLSPNFRSAAAMAGWDEEALLLATLVVEDTPIRESSRQKRRHSKTPPTTSSNSRKRRARRDSSIDVMPVVVLRMDEDGEESKGEKGKRDSGDSSDRSGVCEEKGNQDLADQSGICEEKGNQDLADQSGICKEKGKQDFGNQDGVCEKKEREEGEGSGEKEAGKGIRCLEKLREELSCAICLEICFEPSTTPCGHSFCLKCLKCAAGKCGKKCPKCRQPISNGRSCTINTVLWNTIQLLFPEEVEARKNSPTATSLVRDTLNEQIEDDRNISRSNSSRRIRRRSTQISHAVERDRNTRRRDGPDQSEDAAMAFRLQREEFMVAFRHRSTQVHQSDTFNTSRANLRAFSFQGPYS